MSHYSFLKFYLSLIIWLPVLMLVACSKPGNSGPDAVSDKALSVSTFAGSGKVVYGGQDGSATTAAFFAPKDLMIDFSGNVIVNDYGDYKLRKITSDGDVSTITAISNDAAFTSSPSFGVAMDNDGNIFTTKNNQIFKIAGNGTVSVYAGKPESGFANGSVQNAVFNGPGALTFDKSGNLYVVAQNLYNVPMIRKITSGGVVSTYAGSENTSNTDPARLRGVTCMAFGSSGNLYLCDEGGKVWKVSQNGTLSVLTDFTGERVPWGITVDDKENIYITDGGNGIFEIVKITQDGKAAPILATYNVGKNPVVNFNGPEGIAIDKTGKILYIADTYNNIIRKVVLN